MPIAEFIFGALGEIAGGLILESGGSLLGNVYNYFKPGKKVKDMTEKELRAEMEQRLGAELDKELVAKEVAKFAILNKLAWKDDYLLDSERLFIIDFVLANKRIPKDLKTDLITDIGNNPNSFWDVFKTNYNREELFDNDLEVEGFRKLMIDLAHCDHDFHDSERKYVNEVFKSLGLELV